jgi:hypothetical protein
VPGWEAALNLAFEWSRVGAEWREVGHLGLLCAGHARVLLGSFGVPVRAFVAGLNWDDS